MTLCLAWDQLSASPHYKETTLRDRTSLGADVVMTSMSGHSMILTTGRLYTGQWGRHTGSWCVHKEQRETDSLLRQDAHLELRYNR